MFHVQATLLLALLAAAAPAGAAPVIPFDSAAVTSADGRAFTISWMAPPGITVAVYAGTDAEHIGRDHEVGHGGASGRVTVTGLPPEARWYFALVPDHGRPLVIADRSLHLATAPNFRDAGGYRTSDGHWVKMGLVYRSDQIDKLSDGDLRAVETQRIHLVCDLRTDDERARGADRLPPNATPLVANVLAGDGGLIDTINAARTDSTREREILGNGKGVAVMTSLYRAFVSSPSARHAYAAMFTRLSDSASLPGIFHCTGGKDRSGWAEAVLLTMLGVPRQTIVADYLLTNEYLRAKHAAQLAQLKPGIDPGLLQPLVDARAEYLDAAFDEVDRRYGSFDRYRRDALGLDDGTVAALRSELLSG